MAALPEPERIIHSLMHQNHRMREEIAQLNLLLGILVARNGDPVLIPAVERLEIRHRVLNATKDSDGGMILWVTDGQPEPGIPG